MALSDIFCNPGAGLQGQSSLDSLGALPPRLLFAIILSLNLNNLLATPLRIHHFDEYIDEIYKSSSPEPPGQFQPNEHKASLGVWDSSLFK